MQLVNWPLLVSSSRALLLVSAILLLLSVYYSFLRTKFVVDESISIFYFRKGTGDCSKGEGKLAKKSSGLLWEEMIIPLLFQ